MSDTTVNVAPQQVPPVQPVNPVQPVQAQPFPQEQPVAVPQAAPEAAPEAKRARRASNGPRQFPIYGEADFSAGPPSAAELAGATPQTAERNRYLNLPFNARVPILNARLAVEKGKLERATKKNEGLHVDLWPGKDREGRDVVFAYRHPDRPVTQPAASQQPQQPLAAD